MKLVLYAQQSGACYSVEVVHSFNQILLPQPGNRKCMHAWSDIVLVQSCINEVKTNANLL